MKIIVSIWLSFTLLLTGIPMPGQEEGSSAVRAEGQEQTDSQERETNTQEKESEVQEKESDTREKELEVQKKESDTRKKESEVQEKESDFREEEKEQKPEKKLETKKEQKSDKKQKIEKKADNLERGKELERKKTENTGDNMQEEIPESDKGLEATAENRQEPKRQIIEQDGEKKNLILAEGEAVEDIQTPGYHWEISRQIKCCHSASAINASIKCSRAAQPLRPTSGELSGNVALTGKLAGKNFAAYVTDRDAGGQRNTVSHLRLEAEVDAPGINGQRFELASPYICGDGYAGYAYFEQHFSYCPNTEKFYMVATSHVWLGCTRGDDGTPEFHPIPYEHTFNVYKRVPNNYTVNYDANKGTGTVDSQSAATGKKFALREGKKINRNGYTLAGWNTKKDGTGIAYGLGEEVKNLTTEDAITLYAQWKVNTLTVKYKANGGTADHRTAKFDINFYVHDWNYQTKKQDLINFSSFRLSRTGYSRKDGAEWNTKADGSGRSFGQDVEYKMTDFAPNLISKSQTVTLYAQWEPDIYTITLDHQLKNPKEAGTQKLYGKFGEGTFFDGECTKKVTRNNHKIVIPAKKGYKFRGYYSVPNAAVGTEKINASGEVKANSEGKYMNLVQKDTTWYALYDYLITCEDYADIPCDIRKKDGDSREDLGVRLIYNSDTGKAVVYTKQTGCSVTLTGMPSGTKIGEFQSSVNADSASGNTGGMQEVQLPISVRDGAAYELKVSKEGQDLCSRLVYYKNGRFRTLAKLGEQKAKEVQKGSSLAGSAWNKNGTEEYSLYQYHGCSELKDIKKPGKVQRYFRYKDVNMAYSGNGAGAGANVLEYDVSLENFYQFRYNNFKREAIEKKYTKDAKEYECLVKYGFEGWELSKGVSFQEKQQEQASNIYAAAAREKVISSGTTENIQTYQIAEPIMIPSGTNTVNSDKSVHAKEYINLKAKWDSFPTIVVTPGDKLEFYEGEEVTKDKLISHLTAHDKEDSEKNSDLNEQLRIVKISYPGSENHSQTAYEKIYKKDVPGNFLLDTYYLKLEKGESVNVLVTFAVTDSAGHTTEEEIPVKVKYNHYPEISSEDVFYYLKEEANRGEITPEALLKRATAKDEEDGDITTNLTLKDFDPQAVKQQTKSKEEFDVTYQVTDAYKKSTYKTIKVMVWDGDAAGSEKPRYYVRYISEKYLDTLEKNSIWREPENLAYLKRVLRNETPMQTWKFTHDDVIAVQEWITKRGENWRIGQEANREFPVKFAHCRR